MKISTKTWCQLPSALSKGICVAVVSLCLCGMPTMVSASQTQSSVEQTPSKVLLKGKIVDEAGKPVLKKGKMQADSSKRDTETIPWKEEIDAYMEKNVYPYAPDA